MNELQGQILVVDDTEFNRDMLSRWLERQGHTTITAENGVQALEKLDRHSIDLMLLDIMMPEMNGYQVLEHLKGDTDRRDLPVIVISALDDLDSVIKCIELGAEDFLFKPFNRTLLRARIAASLEKKHLRDNELMYRKQIEEHNLHLEQRVREQVGQIYAAQMATITALAKLAEFRDPDTGRHLERVKAYCRLLLEKLKEFSDYESSLSEHYIEDIVAASVLHDIGKVGIPDGILLKPGKLTTEEFDTIKKHTTIGGDTLHNVDMQYPDNHFILVGIEIAENHHEKWNGDGYPQGKAAKDIPLPGRVVAIADVYDALTSTRCYKDAFPHEESVEIILSENEKLFDPELIQCFTDSLNEFKDIMEHLRDPS